MYLLEGGAPKASPRVQLMGSGAILREVIAAADLLRNDFDVEADVWSVTSFNELRRDGLDAQRWNMLHPTETPREPVVTELLRNREGPVVASTDYMRAYPDQIRAFVPGRYVTLGTDGYGRSDRRERLRHFFEVNRYYVAVAALKALHDEGRVPVETVTQAMAKYGIDPAKPNPVTV
jgi:pyruvate dehydrogenase E1 component